MAFLVGSTCEHCGGGFNTTRPARARWCSDRCRKAAQRARDATGPHPTEPPPRP